MIGPACSKKPERFDDSPSSTDQAAPVSLREKRDWYIGGQDP